MASSQAARGAMRQLGITIGQEGQVHLQRLVRKHLSEKPRIGEHLPSVKSLLSKRMEEFREKKSRQGLLDTYEEEKQKLSDYTAGKLDQMKERLSQARVVLASRPFFRNTLGILMQVSGFQWGLLLPPRDLRLQHHKIEQHFILLRRVPLFFAEVSWEWWDFMLQQTLRKPLSEEEKSFLLSIQSLIAEFRVSFEKGMDVHSQLQQFFTLKEQVFTSKSVTLPIDHFSFQLLERFFTSLLNPPRESE